MSLTETGTIGWVDLTVENAAEVRNFYRKVVGWTSQDVDMGGYSDYNMCSPEGAPVAGICHARGKNLGLPPKWLIYLVVRDLDDSMRECQELGGKVIAGPRNMGNGSRYCVIEDPAGAVAALFDPGF